MTSLVWASYYDIRRRGGCGGGFFQLEGRRMAVVWVVVVIKGGQLFGAY